MILGIITLLSALTISAVAIYYSVAGLAAIFAAAVVPIIIMGVALEVGKLVTAVWLHKHWSRAVWWLKTYLSIAVVVLMFITSMGIFGYLSKAHIEQTSLSQEQVALIGTLEDKESRSTFKIDRWTEEMNKLMKGEDVRVDNLIANEQEELDKINALIKQEKDDVRVDFDKQIQLQNDRLKQAAERKEADIKAAADRFKNSLGGGAKYDKAVEVAKANELSVASAAQKEIQRINGLLNDALAKVEEKYADQIKNIQTRITDLRNQANNKTVDIESRVKELEGFIDSEQLIIDQVREQKFEYEKEYRKLEAEVGPIKYIAEFIYGEEANRNLLEEAVRWVIITIIFVFDPLAVLLLIASQYTFEWARRNKPFDWKSYEQARAQKIVENANQKTTQENEQTEEEVNETIIDTSSTEHNTTETTGPDAEEERDITEKELDRFIGEEEQEVSKEEVTEPVTVQEAFESEEAKEVAEKEYADTKNKIFYAGEADQTKKKELARKEQYEQLEASDAMKDAKYRWKLDHPEETLKGYKTLYIKGVIDKLPWEDYTKNEEEGYKQNAEQDEKSIWKDIKR